MAIEEPGLQLVLCVRVDLLHLMRALAPERVRERTELCGA
jgi:hypothetical protein